MRPEVVNTVPKVTSSPSSEMVNMLEAEQAAEENYNYYTAQVELLEQLITDVKAQAFDAFMADQDVTADTLKTVLNSLQAKKKSILLLQSTAYAEYTSYRNRITNTGQRPPFYSVPRSSIEDRRQDLT